MIEFIKGAANITSQYKLLAYAIAGLLLLVSIIAGKKLKQSPIFFTSIVACIAILAISPTVAQVILSKMSEPNLYHITVKVVKSNGTFVQDPIVDSDVPSGKVNNNGSIQLEISPAHVPANHAVAIIAKDRTGILTGSSELKLGTDLNPVIKITVGRVGIDLAGTVFDLRGNPRKGVSVTIRGGSQDEMAITDSLGRFHFKTHLGEGEVCWIVATVGAKTVEQQTVVSDDPIRIQF